VNYGRRYRLPRSVLNFSRKTACNGRPELCGDAFDLPSQGKSRKNRTERGYDARV